MVTIAFKMFVITPDRSNGVLKPDSPKCFKTRRVLYSCRCYERHLR
jgi:hypothetical protein